MFAIYEKGLTSIICKVFLLHISKEKKQTAFKNKMFNFIHNERIMNLLSKTIFHLSDKDKKFDNIIGLVKVQGNRHFLILLMEVYTDTTSLEGYSLQHYL